MPLRLRGGEGQWAVRSSPAAVPRALGVRGRPTPAHPARRAGSLSVRRAASPADGKTVGIDFLRAELKNRSASPPYILEAKLLSEDVTYNSDLWECRGRDAYLESAKLALKRQRSLLARVQYDAIKFSELGPGELTVRWSISWVPPSMERLVDIGQALPGMKLKYTDILDRLEEEVKFTWANLGRFLARAVFHREIRVPLAVILGSTTFLITSQGQHCDSTVQVKRIVERWDMVPLVASGRLKNRRAGRDLAAIMDTVRPPGVSFEEWEGLVMQKVDMTDVPGMSPMDIDGLDDQAIDNISSIIALLTVVVLAIGGSAAWVVYVKILQARGDFL